MLTGQYQDYDGEPADAKAGREYFRKRFARLAQKANAKEREIYIQYVKSPLFAQTASPRYPNGAYIDPLSH